MENNWKIDETHSEINFKVKHMMISTVTGNFESFDAKVESSDDSFKDAKFQFNADIESVNTRNKDRDTHLKSEDFFNAEKFPKLSFKSTAFDGEKLKGELTIKDVTKEVELDVDFNGVAEDPYGQTKAGFDMETSINRKDFDLTWSAVTEAGSIVVSDKVKLIANVQFVKQ
ncbi:YceI family protein [Brumimicrobium aurantiacum]|uniref:Polyisoprenoid-binding protein n=1 Tax=Brumimicrobium aurantiacum TaxID=1737063 RepID=A0A3E1F1J5_9FLAO|nr:YceI family protein [Brumimicrobium aurantiacum]RFC55680.1 polyisoprenoid-binding protein [Brumimicrobium aurantiacum]